MKPVFISLAHSGERKNHLRRAFELAGLDFSEFDDLGRHLTGKPFLKFNPYCNRGYSVSHTRDIEAIALVDEECEIGIDLEIWPHRMADPDFVEAVACPEDGKTLKILSETGYDGGIALWVMKEAALKCTGEVMTDPRHISVKHLAQNVFAVRSSASARSPHPEIDVSLHILTNETVLLLGIAMPAGSLMQRRTFRSMQFSPTSWKMVKFGQ